MSKLSLVLLVAIVAVVAASENATAARPFTCLFFPGEGLDWPKLDVDVADRAKDHEFVKTEFNDYWGDSLVKEVTTGQRCEKVFFYDTDTSYRGWREKSLAIEFNNAMKEVRPHVVFAHSMGNLVLSACVKRKLPYCEKLGSKIQWFGIQAPLRGTDVVKVMKKLCPTLLKDAQFGTGVDCAQKNDTKTGKPVSPAEYVVAESWDSLRESEVPSWVATIASEKMHGSMCGMFAADYSESDVHKHNSTAFGALAYAMGGRKRQRELLKKDWAAKNKVSTRVPKFANDGIVPFSSCRVDGNKKYEKSPKAHYYAVDGNHDFGTCSLGQKAGSGSQEPCTWMAEMVQSVRTKLGLPARFQQIEDADESEAEIEDEDEAEAEDEDETEAEDEDEAEEEDSDETEESDEAEDEDEAEAEEEVEAEEEADQ